MTFLQSIAGYAQAQRTGSEDRPIRIATVDPAFDIEAGLLPKVTFDGESTMSTKRYPYGSGYVPLAGDRVVMLPIGTTYWMVGSVSNHGRQGFSADPASDYFVTHFGEDSYVEVDGGSSLLVVDGATVDGQSVAALPRGIVLGKAYTSARVVGLTNTELFINMDTGSFLFEADRLYWIWVRMKVFNTVANDDWIFRLRETNTAGAQRGEFVWRNQSASYGWSLPPLAFPVKVASDTTMNLVWTGQRLAGTGSLNVEGGTSNIQATSIAIEDKGLSSAWTVS